MANFTAEQYDTLQEILKVITEARQASERLSEIWAKGLANPIGPHTTHLSSLITPMTPSQSPQSQVFMIECEDDEEEAHQIQETVTIPEKTANNSDPFMEPLERASVLHVPDVFMVCKVDSHVNVVEESPLQSTNSNDKNVAHQVFAEMPLGVTSKEKQRKSLKAWKFKFKASFKRSKLMGDMFSAVEETVLLNKDLKETIWDFVKKEFKETRAAYGKKITDRFKVVDETTKPAAYDGKFQIRVWDCGGSLLECVWWRRLKHCQRYCHEMQAIEAENKSPETLGDHPFAPMKPCQSYAQPCLKCEAEMTIPLVKETQDRIVNEWFKVQVFSDFDVASWIGLEIYGCETKKHMLLCVNLANRVWERGELLATHLYWELFGLKALIGLEIYKWKCKQLPIASNFRINHPHELADLVLKRALTEQDTSLARADWRTKNSVPFVIQCMAVQEMVLMQANEKITKTETGQAHEFQGTIVPNLAPDFVMQLHQIGSSILQEVHEELWLALPISTANQKKGIHRKNYMIQWSWHCVKHESQQTDFHVWHRWKIKAANLHAVYAISELMMLRLVSFQSSKGNGVAGIVSKAIRIVLARKLSGGSNKEVYLVCSGKRWSFVVYAFSANDQTVVLRIEPFLLPKIRRGYENKITAGMSRGQSVHHHHEIDYENEKFYLLRIEVGRVHMLLLLKGIGHWLGHQKGVKLHLLIWKQTSLLLQFIKRLWSEPNLWARQKNYKRYGRVLGLIQKRYHTGLVGIIGLQSVLIKDSQMYVFVRCSSLLLSSGFDWKRLIEWVEIYFSQNQCQDYSPLLFLERVKDSFQIMLMVEHFENPLVSILTQEVFHSQRPPEISTKASSLNILNFILEDKDVLNRGVLLQEISSQPTIFFRFISILSVNPIIRFSYL